MRPSKHCTGRVSPDPCGRTELIPLFASAKSLTGIGPRMEILLKKALRLPPGVSEPRVIDLLWHTPTGVIDRRADADRGRAPCRAPSPPSRCAS